MGVRPTFGDECEPIGADLPTQPSFVALLLQGGFKDRPIQERGQPCPREKQNNK